MKGTPRRKRLKKAARLTKAKEWIKSYHGKDLVKGYARWFGVDWLCALKELKLAGVPFTPEAEERINNSYRQRIEHKKRLKQLRSSKQVTLSESDENFAFIVGYTSNGVPYGLTHEEWPDEVEHIPDE